MKTLTADIPSEFWAVWIAILTTIGVAGLVWMLFGVYFPANHHDEHELPTWDENLREGTRNPPLWWFWMLLALLIISDIYLILYPGFGRFEGLLKWSRAGRLSVAEVKYADDFNGMRNLVATAPLETLQSDPKLMAAAERVFAQHCAACHGFTGEGQANMFPNLRDNHWQWGAAPVQIETSIRNGRMGVMPAWQAVLGDEGVDTMASYVLALSGADDASQHPGREQYMRICIGCHGPEAKGNVALGAPDLTSGVRVRGDDEALLRQTISQGYRGKMPAFNNRLDDTQVRMLVAWLTVRPH